MPGTVPGVRRTSRQSTFSTSCSHFFVYKLKKSLLIQLFFFRGWREGRKPFTAHIGAKKLTEEHYSIICCLLNLTSWPKLEREKCWKRYD